MSELGSDRRTLSARGPRFAKREAMPIRNKEEMSEKNKRSSGRAATKVKAGAERAGEKVKQAGRSVKQAGQRARSKASTKSSSRSR
jgi:hypothetical protein